MGSKKKNKIFDAFNMRVILLPNIVVIVFVVVCFFSSNIVSNFSAIEIQFATGVVTALMVAYIALQVINTDEQTELLNQQMERFTPKVKLKVNGKTYINEPFIENDDIFLENISAVEIRIYDWNYIFKNDKKINKPNELYTTNPRVSLKGAIINPYSTLKLKLSSKQINVDNFLKNNDYLTIELEGNFDKERIKIDIRDIKS